MLSKKFDLVDCRYFNLMNIREEIVWHEALWSWGLHRHIGYIGYVLLIKSFRWLWFYWVVVYFILVRLSFFPSFYFCFVSFSSLSLYSPLVPALTPFPLPHFHFLFLILPSLSSSFSLFLCHSFSLSPARVPLLFSSILSFYLLTPVSPNYPTSVLLSFSHSLRSVIDTKCYILWISWRSSICVNVDCCFKVISGKIISCMIFSLILHVKYYMYLTF